MRLCSQGDTAQEVLDGRCNQHGAEVAEALGLSHGPAVETIGVPAVGRAGEQALGQQKQTPSIMRRVAARQSVCPVWSLLRQGLKQLLWQSLVVQCQIPLWPLAFAEDMVREI